MASAKRSKAPIREEDLKKLESKIQELNGMSAQYRPKTFPHVYIASHLGVTSRTVQGWVRKAKKVAHLNDTSQRFYELYSKIADLLSEQMAATLFRMAEDSGNRNALASAKYLLPKINPVMYGEGAGLEDDDEASTQVADIPQEVFDNMTEREIDEIDKLHQAIADAMTRSEEIVQKAQQRVLAQRISSDQTTVH